MVGRSRKPSCTRRGLRPCDPLRPPENSNKNLSKKKEQEASRTLPAGWSATCQNPRALRAPKLQQKDQRKETSHSTRISGSSRIGIEEPFQAHLPLESILDFRLICGLENAVRRKLWNRGRTTEMAMVSDKFSKSDLEPRAPEVRVLGDDESGDNSRQ